MYKDFCKLYKNELDLNDNDNYSEKDDDIIEVFSKAIQLSRTSFNLENTNPSKLVQKNLVTWKFCCHLIQAYNTYLSSIILKWKNKQVFNEKLMLKMCLSLNDFLIISIFEILKLNLSLESYQKLVVSFLSSILYFSYIIISLDEKLSLFLLCNTCKLINYYVDLQINSILDTILSMKLTNSLFTQTLQVQMKDIYQTKLSNVKKVPLITPFIQSYHNEFISKSVLFLMNINQLIHDSNTSCIDLLLPKNNNKDQNVFSFQPLNIDLWIILNDIFKLISHDDNALPYLTYLFEFQILSSIDNSDLMVSNQLNTMVLTYFDEVIKNISTNILDTKQFCTQFDIITWLPIVIINKYIELFINKENHPIIDQSNITIDAIGISTIFNKIVTTCIPINSLQTILSIYFNKLSIISIDIIKLLKHKNASRSYNMINEVLLIIILQIISNIHKLNEQKYDLYHYIHHISKMMKYIGSILHNMSENSCNYSFSNDIISLNISIVNNFISLMINTLQESLDNVNKDQIDSFIDNKIKPILDIICTFESICQLIVNKLKKFQQSETVIIATKHSNLEKLLSIFITKITNMKSICIQINNMKLETIINILNEKTNLLLTVLVKLHFESIKNSCTLLNNLTFSKENVLQSLHQTIDMLTSSDELLTNFQALLCNEMISKLNKLLISSTERVDESDIRSFILLVIDCLYNVESNDEVKSETNFDLHIAIKKLYINSMIDFTQRVEVNKESMEIKLSSYLNIIQDLFVWIQLLDPENNLKSQQRIDKSFKDTINRSSNTVSKSITTIQKAFYSLHIWVLLSLWSNYISHLSTDKFLLNHCIQNNAFFLNCSIKQLKIISTINNSLDSSSILYFHTFELSLHHLYNLFFIYGRSTDQLRVCNYLSNFISHQNNHIKFMYKLDDIYSLYRSKFKIYYTITGAWKELHEDEYQVLYKLWNIQPTVDLYKCIESYVNTCYCLLQLRNHDYLFRNVDLITIKQLLKKSSNSFVLDQIKNTFPLNKEQFIKYTTDVLTTCSFSEKSLGITYQYVFLSWLYLLYAKVLFLVFDDIEDAYEYGKKSLKHCFFVRKDFYSSNHHHHHIDNSMNIIQDNNKNNIQTIYLDNLLLQFEVNIFLAELHEHTGNINVSLQYLGECTYLSKCIGTKTVQNILTLHTLRIWYRASSSKLITLIDELHIIDEYDQNTMLDEISKLIRKIVIKLSHYFQFNQDIDDDNDSKIQQNEGLNSILMYRYMNCYWDLKNVNINDKLSINDFKNVVYNHVLSTKLRNDIDIVINKDWLDNHQHLQDNDINDLLEFLYNCKSFEGTRDIRRRKSLYELSYYNMSNNKHSGNKDNNISSNNNKKDKEFNITSNEFISYLAGISSCQMSLEYMLDLNNLETTHHSLSNQLPVSAIVEFSQYIHKSLIGDELSKSYIENQLYHILNQMNQLLLPNTSSNNNNNSLCCFITVDTLHNNIILGRLDSDKHLPLVVNIPIKQQINHSVHTLLSNWDEMQERNKVMLRQGLDITQIEKLTSKQKQIWWNSRQSYDEMINAYLIEFQSILGPWIMLFYNKSISIYIEKYIKLIIYQIFLFPDIKVDIIYNKLSHWLELVYVSIHKSKDIATSTISIEDVEQILDYLLNRYENLIRYSNQQIDLTLLKSNLISKLYEDINKSNDISHTSSTDNITSNNINNSSNSIDNDLMVEYEQELNALKLIDLRNKLREFHLDTTGRKSELIDRLLLYKTQSLSNKSSSTTTTLQSITSSDIDIEGGHLILILDEKLQKIPFECIPILRIKSCSRIPNMVLLLKLIQQQQQLQQQLIEKQLSASLQNISITTATNINKSHSIKKSNYTAKKVINCKKIEINNNKNNVLDNSNDRNTNKFRGIELQKCWYAIDIENNLQATKDKMEIFLQKYLLAYSWNGYVSKLPEPSVVKENHENMDLFIFCGHGSGEIMYDSNKFRKFKSCPSTFLWGCSSGKLYNYGIYDSIGPALYYLLGGSIFIVGNLWDVTDKDIDNLSITCMENSLLIKHNNDKHSDNNNCINENNNQLITYSLMKARDVCKMKNAVGNSPVIYGLPCTINQ